MAKWQEVIDISAQFYEYQVSVEYPIEEIGRVLGEKLRFSKLYQNAEYREDLADFANRFEDTHEIEDFDELLDELYDWGDIDHRLFIKTISMVPFVT